SIDSYYGLGVWVSTNGGGIWTLSGGNGVFRGTAIAQVAIDQRDANSAWVAVSNNVRNGNPGAVTGIYRTTDGGQSWNNTTAAIDTADPWSAVVIDPTTSTAGGGNATLFAVVGSR